MRAHVNLLVPLNVNLLVAGLHLTTKTFHSVLIVWLWRRCPMTTALSVSVPTLHVVGA